MSKPNDDAGMPILLTLQPGTYYRCTCGRSNNLPFCDESHSGSASHPLRFEIDHEKPVYICSCGKTDKAPFCDGTCGFALPLGAAPE